MTYDNEQEPTPEEVKRGGNGTKVVAIGIAIVLCVAFWFSFGCLFTCAVWSIVELFKNLCR